MDNFNYIKYNKIINDANKIIKKNNINILKIGWQIEEVFNIFLNIMSDNTILIYLNSYKYDSYLDNYFDNIIKINSMIKSLNRENQVKILDEEVTTGINNLYNSKEYSFDIIYIDFNINKNNLLLDIILCFELLNGNGIIIFDNYYNSNINDLKTPIFIIKTFMRIYIYDINIISCEIDNYETIVLQKKINYKKEKTKIDKIFDKIINYRLPIEPFILPSPKYEKLEWNIEYYEEPFDINAELYKLYDDKHIIDEILEYHKLYKDIKNLKMNILDYNYFIQSKNNVQYDTYLEYLNIIYKDYNINKYQIKNIISNNIFTNNLVYKRQIIQLKYKINLLVQQTQSKNIKLLILSDKYQSKYYKENNNVIYNNYFSKNIKIYNIYYIKYNKYKNKYSKYLNNIKDISYFKIKYDYIGISNKLYNNSKNIYYDYIKLIYYILYNQKNKGTCIIHINLNLLCNNIIYEILYILSLYYENIYIKNLEHIYLSSFTLTFEYTNFKGINNNELINIYNNINKLLKCNNIKSIINNINNEWYNLIKQYVYINIIDKLNFFNNKYNFIKYINEKSYDIYKKYLLQIFKYQLIYILNIKI